MAKPPNYEFVKRQKELKKKKKSEEKRLRKLNKGNAQPGDEFETATNVLVETKPIV